MRTFYYGADGNKRGENQQTRSGREDSFLEEFVEEEDTVYEIDRACVECLKRIRKKKISDWNFPTGAHPWGKQ